MTPGLQDSVPRGRGQTQLHYKDGERERGNSGGFSVLKSAPVETEKKR